MARDIRRLFQRNKKPPLPGVEPGGYLCRMDTAAVIKHNTLMNGITSTRGQAMGFVQEDLLVLGEDGRFTLTKELKSTKTSLLMKEPVSVVYSFTGPYTKNADCVALERAESGAGKVCWGTFAKFLDTGDGDYDSATSPGILNLYPTAFFVENCKNVPMTVRLNEAERSFTIDEFEPVILSPEEAGQISVQVQALDPNAGLMAKPLTDDMSAYSLKETFASHGMKIGTCINPLYIVPPYEQLLVAQFSSVTLENHLKPGYTLSQEKSKAAGKLSVSFPEETVRLLNWCKEHDMPLRGHTLIWYLGTPEWVFHEGFEADAPNVGREELLRRMEDFIADFFAELQKGGWSELMYCIDVVNEAIIAPDKMRKCPWQEIIGDDYVYYAFLFARKYAPQHMLLAHNDFDLETKTDKVIELVKSVNGKSGRRLVDMIGQQGHYGAYSSIETLSPALTKLCRETGCELQITELDVSVSRQGTEEELKTQGRFYYDFVQEILRLKEDGVQITGLTLWGFADALSWMPGGYLHLYDRKLVPKYAYFGLLGVKDQAGFDGSEERKESGWTSARFEIPVDPSRFILLREDGSYTDTTLGAEQLGSYRFDGASAYMLTPRAGGYCNLIVNPDGSAERVEAAGGRMALVKR